MSEYDQLLTAVRETMPTPHPWENQMDDVAAAVGWLAWLPDVIAHQQAQALRNRRRELPLRAAIKLNRIADELDPFVWQESGCNYCSESFLAVWGLHWHRKRDGKLVPAAVLGVPV